MKHFVITLLIGVFLLGPTLHGTVSARNGITVSNVSTINGRTPNSAINGQTLISANTTSNMVSYWKLDVAGGADAFGTNTLTATSISTVAAKISNGASMARASSSRLVITDASQTGLDLGADWTIAFWYKPTSQPTAGNPHTLVSKWNETSNQRSYIFYYSISGATPVFEYYINIDGGAFGTAGTTVNQTLTNGTFYHIAIGFVASTTRYYVYLNGTLINGANGFNMTVGPCFNGTAAFGLGTKTNTTPADFADGVFDEVVVYTRMLSALDISYLYNSGSGQRPPGI